MHDRQRSDSIGRTVLHTVAQKWCMTCHPPCDKVVCNVLYVVEEVRGVTVLDNIMYVVCGESSTIRLYNTDTHRAVEVVINVNGLRDPRDIVVCRDDRQLYLVDCYSLWRVSVSDHSYVKWLSTESTTDTFHALSVTSRRLLVTSLGPPRLRQYSTTDRRLLRVVKLPQYMSEVYHGVETTRGTFVVGHWGTSQGQRQWAVSELFSCVIT